MCDRERIFSRRQESRRYLMMIIFIGAKGVHYQQTGILLYSKENNMTINKSESLKTNSIPICVCVKRGKNPFHCGPFDDKHLVLLTDSNFAPHRFFLLKNDPRKKTLIFSETNTSTNSGREFCLPL